MGAAVQMPKFQDTRDTLQDRPWCVDDLDAALDRLTSETNPVKKAVFFCDNAGSDVVLGAPPALEHLQCSDVRCGRHSSRFSD